MIKNNEWFCRYAPSLGALEETHQSVWGTHDYECDKNAPTVFFGLYGLPDFYSLWRHKGRKAILWAGSDIKHFLNGYWLDENGQIRIEPESLAIWIDKNCENYVENEVEQQALNEIGIKSIIIPSFLGNIKNYNIEYKQSDRPCVWVSTGKDRQLEYGFGIIEEIADKCDVDFYLYGDNWDTKHSNVFVRGRIDKEKMNEEIKHMQAGLRLNEFDGCSEVICKSILWGQHPISAIKYPFVGHFNTKEELISMLNALKYKTLPNMLGREWFIKNLNNYPWNENNKEF